jgi:hypothetical protein
MAFRTDENKLAAFIGNDCNEISIDGKVYRFSDQPLSKIVFIPETNGKKTVCHVQITGAGTVRLPITGAKLPAKIKTGKQTIPLKATDGGIELKVDDSISGKWLIIDVSGS